MTEPQEDAASQFIRQYKEDVRPLLVQGVSDDLFHPGRELELLKRIEEIVDSQLIKDKIPIGRQLRLKFIQSIMDDIAIARKQSDF